MPTGLLLLLLVVWTVASSPVCTESDYASYYFSLCIADPLCQEALDLNLDDQTLFANLLSTTLLSATHLTYVDMCQSVNVTGLWLGFITGFPFCQWNQVPDLERECVCREDRLCEPLHPSRFRIDTLGLYAVVLVAGTIVIYTLLSVSKDSREIRKRWAGAWTK